MAGGYYQEDNGSGTGCAEAVNPACAQCSRILLDDTVFLPGGRPTKSRFPSPQRRAANCRCPITSSFSCTQPAGDIYQRGTLGSIALKAQRQARKTDHQAFPRQPQTFKLAVEALSQQIISIQSLVACQSGSLWRNPCIGGTLAGNYRLGPDYNVDYSAQESHPSDQNPTPHAYGQQPRQGRPSVHQPGQSALHEPPPPHSQHAMPPHHPAQQHPQLLMDPSQIGGYPGARHMAQPGPVSHYGAPGPSPHALTAPLYPTMTPTPGPPHGTKRGRPDDLDLNSMPGMAELEQENLSQMQQTSMGSAYAAAAAPQPTHHHHRLPDHGRPSKAMRYEDEGADRGGAPNVVGQAGMPPPAPRPKGPKLKFTPEDDQLLIELKEHKSLTWKQIANFFPGRSSGTLQVRYCTKLKAKTTQWTEETVFNIPFPPCSTTTSN